MKSRNLENEIIVNTSMLMSARDPEETVKSKGKKKKKKKKKKGLSSKGFEETIADFRERNMFN